MAYRKLSDFPKLFVDAWDAAKRNELHLAFPNRGAATNMRYRLNHFRRLLRDEAGDFSYDYIMLQVVQKEAGKWIITSELPDWAKQIDAITAAHRQKVAEQGGMVDGTENSPEPDTIYSRFSRGEEEP